MHDVIQEIIAIIKSRFSSLQSLLNGVLGTAIYQDDIMITGKTKEEYLHWLDMFQ